MRRDIKYHDGVQNKILRLKFLVFSTWFACNVYLCVCMYTHTHTHGKSYDITHEMHCHVTMAMQDCLFNCLRGIRSLVKIPSLTGKIIETREFLVSVLQNQPLIFCMSIAGKNLQNKIHVAHVCRPSLTSS